MIFSIICTKDLTVTADMDVKRDLFFFVNSIQPSNNIETLNYE